MVQSSLHPNMMIPLGPYNSCGNPHQNVQHGPYRRKNLIGRGKNGLAQRSIPIIHGALRGNTGQKAYQQAAQNTDGYVDNSFFHGWCKNI